jgi:hypothetical protein
MSKKPFKETTVGKLLFGAATVINPTLGSVLNGVTSPKEALGGKLMQKAVGLPKMLDH